MKWNFIFGIILLSVALIGLVILVWPVSTLSTQIPFSLPDNLSGTLDFEQSKRIHVGDGTVIGLKVTFDRNLQERKLLTLFSKLELDHVEISPTGEGKVSVDPAKPVELNWMVTPHKSGTYSGTLWLFSDSINGDRNLILARPIKLTAKTFLGFSFQSARLICSIGLFLGILSIIYPKIIKK